MRVYKMNIDDVHLQNVKREIKIHEYRLANDKRKAVKVGDLINLTRRDLSDNVLVRVNGIRIYPSIEDALLNTPDYLNDFTGVCADLNECVKLVNSYYDESDIKHFGIIVFDIEKVK